MRKILRFSVPFLPIIGIVILVIGLFNNKLNDFLAEDEEGFYDFVLDMNKHPLVFLFSMLVQAFFITLIPILCN